MQPDILVARRVDLTDRNLPHPPVLAVEVLSPSARLIDLNLKRARYERAGVASYWVVDPDDVTLTAWRLRDGEYVEVASVAGAESWSCASPFEVTVVPEALLG